MDKDGIVVSADEVAYYEVKLADTDSTSYPLSKSSVYVKIGEASEVVTLGQAGQGWQTYYATNQNNIGNVTVNSTPAPSDVPVEFTVTISSGWVSGTTLEIGFAK